MVAPTQYLLGHPTIKVSSSSPTKTPESCYCKTKIKRSSSSSSSSYHSRSSSVISKKKKQKKRVRFCTGPVDVQIIENRRLLTKQEKENCYMSKYELDKIRRDIRISLQKFSTVVNNVKKEEDDGTQTQEDEEELFLDGLEFYLPRSKHIDRIRHTRNTVRTVVKQQQQFGILDEQWLRNFYSVMTVKSTISARVQAMKDQQSDPAAPPYQQVMIR